MRSLFFRILAFSLVGMIALTACGSLAPATSLDDGQGEALASTLSAFSTQIALTPRPVFPTTTTLPQHLSATPTSTIDPALAATLQADMIAHANAIALEDSLCQQGRGRGTVISSVHKGDRIRVYGRATKWWAIENPIYHVPCWVASTALQIDPGVDPLSIPQVSSLYPSTPSPNVQFLLLGTPNVVAETPTPTATSTP